MKFSDLKCCPFCKSEEFYEKEYAKGSITYRMRFDGEETDNSTMYDNLDHYSSGRAYCDDCNRYLGNYMTDKLGKAAYQEYLNSQSIPDEAPFEIPIIHTTVEALNKITEEGLQRLKRDHGK